VLQLTAAAAGPEVGRMQVVWLLCAW
jgi:hypothetical protein